MNDFFYNLRKAKNKLKRKFQEANDDELAEGTEYVSSFKIIMVALLSVIALSMVFIILLLTNVINIGGDAPAETSLSAETSTPTAEVTATLTASPTEEPTAVPTPSPTPRPTLIPGPTPKLFSSATPIPLTEDDVVVEVGWVDADYLNVRTGPTENYPRIGQLPKYSVVEVLEVGRWMKIKIGDGAGYCTNTYYHSGYLPSDKYSAMPTIPPSDQINADRIVEADYSHVTADIKIFIDEVKELDRQYYVAEIWCDASHIKTLLASETLDTTVRGTTSDLFDMADDAIFAINGDFISYHNDGIAIRNGKIYRDRGGLENLILYGDGEMVGVMPDKIDAETLLDDGALHCWSYGPILVQNYVAYDDFSTRSTLNPNNPRTGIGMIEPGHYIIIVADGRREDYSGPTLPEFAQWFEDYGCKVAYNLEGGSTSTMVFKGEVINTPSGESEKATGDIIYIS